MNEFNEHEEERIDEIIPRVIENMERRKNKNMTEKEWIDKIVAKQKELADVQKEWDRLHLEAVAVQGKAEKLLYEFGQLLNDAQNITGEITPNNIINGGEHGK